MNGVLVGGFELGFESAASDADSGAGALGLGLGFSPAADFSTPAFSLAFSIETEKVSRRAKERIFEN